MPCGCKKKKEEVTQITENKIPHVTIQQTYTFNAKLNTKEDWRQAVMDTIRMLSREKTDEAVRSLRIRSVRAQHPSRGDVAVCFINADGRKKVYATAIRKKLTRIIGTRTIPSRGKQA